MTRVKKKEKMRLNATNRYIPTGTNLSFVNSIIITIIITFYFALTFEEPNPSKEHLVISECPLFREQLFYSHNSRK